MRSTSVNTSSSLQRPSSSTIGSSTLAGMATRLIRNTPMALTLSATARTTSITAASISKIPPQS
jgi:hypothetical protein